MNTARVLGPVQPSIAKSFQVPGTPFSSCSPRSMNSMPRPMTRSLTVLDTRISCETASAHTRAAMWTASTEVPVPDFALTGVEPHSELKAVWHYRLVDCLGTANRSRRTVEGQEKPVACRSDLDTLEPSNLLS